MGLNRRTVVKLLAGIAIGGTGGGGIVRSRALGAALSLRNVTAADATVVRSMMNMCVQDDGAFHGKCGEWSSEWATEFVTRAPRSVVLTLDGLPVAFQEVPTIRAVLPALSDNATDAEQDRYAVRQANRARFHLTAAGVRADVLTPAEAQTMFRRVLYYGFRAAREQGFEVGEGFFPWEQHPNMGRAWTDYPGCTLMDRPSISAADGRRVYWLRWTLDEVISALAAEGAGNEALDVA